MKEAICPVCASFVREDLLEAHLRWHKNLRNIPLDEAGYGQ